MEIQKIFTDVTGEECLYSVLLNEEELRTFGVVSDLIHSGAKRTYRKYVGRGRKKLAGKVLESMKRDAGALQLTSMEFDNMQKTTNSALRGKLYKKGHELGAHTRNLNPSYFGQGTSFNVPISNISGDIGNKETIDAIRFWGGNKEADKFGKVAKKFDRRRISGNLKNSETLVVHQNNAGDAILAHELGHIGNRKEGSSLAKKIKNHDLTSGIREKAKYVDPSNPTQNYVAKPTIKEAIKNKVDGLVMRAEESNASKRGLGYMKKAGYSKEDLSQAKKLLNKAGETYKHGEHLISKAPLYEKLQIPSRRGKSVIQLLQE